MSITPAMLWRGRVPREARVIHRPATRVWNVGWIAVFAALALSIVGILSIATTESGYAARQIAFLCIAIIGAGAIAVPHHRWLQPLSLPLLIIVLGLLVFVLLPFVPDAIVRPRKGARRWINLGLMDFQPSELAKIAYILALASYLRYRKNYRRLVGLLGPFVLTFIPMLLILREPDLGTAMLFLPTLFAMLLAAGAKLKHLAIIVLIGVVAAPGIYPILEPHQKNRINALYYQIKGDMRYASGIGFQGQKAMTLVGAGEFTGVGRTRAAVLIEHNRLPEEHNDMVFAVIACRWGALGAAGVIALYLALCAGGLLTAAACRDPFARLVAVGVVAMLFSQMAINVGMTIGLLPITGMTLPFVSYGGSSLVATWLMVGLLLNVGMRRPLLLARDAFTFDEEHDR